jgi:hypothetical protein
MFVSNRVTNHPVAAATEDWAIDVYVHGKSSADSDSKTARRLNAALDADAALAALIVDEARKGPEAEITRLRVAMVAAVSQRATLLDIDTTPALVFKILDDLRTALES